jgi:hypothetical protein
MPALTIDLPEHYLNVAREVAESEGVSLETWCSKGLQSHLLRLAAEAVAEEERQHPEETAAFYAEREVEHEAMYAKEQQEEAGTDE